MSVRERRCKVHFGADVDGRIPREREREPGGLGRACLRRVNTRRALPARKLARRASQSRSYNTEGGGVKSEIVARSRSYCEGVAY